MRMPKHWTFWYFFGMNVLLTLALASDWSNHYLWTWFTWTLIWVAYLGITGTCWLVLEMERSNREIAMEHHWTTSMELALEGDLEAADVHMKQYMQLRGIKESPVMGWPA